MAARLLTLTLALSALTVSPVATGQERPTFSANSELVVLHVTVEDRKGTYISGLPREAFTVLDDGQPQDVEFFSAADTPASIGLIIDNSTSMWNKRELVAAAAEGFTTTSNPEDELFVLAFNENVTEVWRPQFIKDCNLDAMRATLLDGIAAHGKTALYDAIGAGLAKLGQGKHVRQVLVVISDGSDNASSLTLEQVLGRVRTTDAAIFTVMIKDPIDEEGNPKLLKRMASETGGEAFEVDARRDMHKTLTHIARDIRSAYTIGFAPATTIGERALRKLQVNVRTKDGRTLNARARGGYVTRAR